MASSPDTPRTCPHGHVLDDANTYLYKNHRSCLTCRREHARRAYVRRREAKAQARREAADRLAKLQPTCRDSLGIAAIPPRRHVWHDDDVLPAHAVTFDPADPFAMDSPHKRTDRVGRAERIAEARRMGMYGWED